MVFQVEKHKTACLVILLFYVCGSSQDVLGFLQISRKGWFLVAYKHGQLEPAHKGDLINVMGWKKGPLQLPSG